MLEYEPYRIPGHPPHPRRSTLGERQSDYPIRARVKAEWTHLYPGVDPKVWYQVVQEGEYRDDMEGLWIQVTDWVTYVLVKHFDLDARPRVN